MMHSNRVWSVTPVASADELARKLTETTWTCCTAFAIGEYLWLNDATCPDGAQEYAVVKRTGPDGRLLQIESITFSWCDHNKALALIEQTLRGEHDDSDFAHEVSLDLESPDEHGRCRHCA